MRYKTYSAGLPDIYLRVKRLRFVQELEAAGHTLLKSP